MIYDITLLSNFFLDPPGVLGCKSCLINDLDLFIKKDALSKTWFPNGRSSPDTSNNAERVIIPNVQDGEKYFINVEARNLDRASQVYSLVVSGCITFDSSRFKFSTSISSASMALSLGPWIIGATIVAACVSLF